jgi:putative ABC transport system permease protein
MALISGIRLSGHTGRASLYRRVIGTGAVQLLGVKLLAGRLLSDKRAQDRVIANDMSGMPANNGHSVLINAAAAAGLGLTPQQAIGQTIVTNKVGLRIVGVLADARFDGARERAQPSLYVYDPGYAGYALIRIRPGATARALSFIDREWHAFAPTKAVWRYFLDDGFDRLYQADERQGELFGIFVLVAIFIACLGLFGIAAFATARRTREIGVRKVFGARTRDVTLLLLWQFSVPVLLANLIAWPAAWLYLHNWLQGFADRITLSPAYFIAAGLAALLIAWATIFIHALRVARANPIHALRTE